MSDHGYMIWFVATAAMIITVLTVGTLAAAGLIGHDKSPTRPRAIDDRASGDSDVLGAPAYANAGRQR